MARAVKNKSLLLFFLLALAVCLSLCLAPPLLTAHRRTARLARLWQEFTSALARGDLQAAKDLTTYSDDLSRPNWEYCRFTDDQIVCCGRDITDTLARSKLSYRRTFTSNLADPPSNKIVFDCGTIGHAIIEDRIVWIKIP